MKKQCFPKIRYVAFALFCALAVQSYNAPVLYAEDSRLFVRAYTSIIDRYNEAFNYIVAANNLSKFEESESNLIAQKILGYFIEGIEEMQAIANSSSPDMKRFRELYRKFGLGSKGITGAHLSSAFIRSSAGLEFMFTHPYSHEEVLINDILSKELPRISFSLSDYLDYFEQED